MGNQRLFRRIWHEAAVVTQSEAEGDNTAEVAVRWRWSRFTWVTRSRMRSSSASATADGMVKTSSLMPLPVTSMPRSIMCRLTQRAFSLASTSSASRADRYMRSSFGVISTSPGLRSRQKSGPLRPLREEDRTEHAPLDEHAVHGQAEHERVARDGPLLHVKALAFLGLAGGADAI
jgi:hypothetical protein